MDNLTHSLFGVTLGRTRLARAGRGVTAALVLASNAPDVDAVAALKGGASYLAWHRGPTHGLLGIVGLGVGAAALVWGVGNLLDRRRPPANGERPRASFAMLCAVSMIGVAFHILMDLPTSYGTRVLSPFDWRWFAVDWMPIVDIYLLGVLVAGTIFGQVSERSKHWNASIVLTLMAAIYGVRAFAHREAIRSAPELFGPALPPRCDAAAPIDAGMVSWPGRADASLHHGRCLVDMAAIPTFASPFRWHLIAHLSNAYELHDVDVLDTRLREGPSAAETFWRMTIRYPNVWSEEVETAATTRLGQAFLGFSRFPAARWVVDSRSGTTIVRWTDMRFVGGLSLDRAAGRGTLFTATVRLDRDQRVIDEHFGP